MTNRLDYERRECFGGSRQPLSTKWAALAGIPGGVVTLGLFFLLGMVVESGGRDPLVLLIPLLIPLFLWPWVYFYRWRQGRLLAAAYFVGCTEISLFAIVLFCLFFAGTIG